LPSGRCILIALIDTLRLRTMRPFERPLNVLVSFLIILALWPGEASSQRVSSSAANVFTLRPGDLIRLEIWREEDLSGEFRVNELGVVTLPLIGAKDTKDVPMGELRNQLIAEYRIQLQNPSITVTPLRQVHVLGEVNQPGMYAIDPTVTLAGAIALAGGASSLGDLRKIQIVRDGNVISNAVQAEATLDQIDMRSGDQIFVERRNWFERNMAFVITALISVTSLVVSFSR
jgi:protein involved in polysaccharide export with SLBB domain